MLQHGKPTMNWFPPSDRCDWWIKDCFLSAPYIDRAVKTRKWNVCEVALKCVNKLILFTGMFEFCRSNCFKERSQWRLESRRSPFFFSFLSVLFVVVVVFFINYNYSPLACFPLFSLLTLYTLWDFYIYRLFRNSLLKFRFFSSAT